VAVDRYTKIVLTIIAVCLLWLSVMTTGRPAQAQSLTPMGSLPGGVQPVVIVGWGSMDQQGRVALRFISDNGVRRTDATLPVRADNALPVKLPYSADDPLPTRLNTQDNPLSVSITAIRRGDGLWDPIRTQVEPANTRDKPGGGNK
jgi:hypothetical protein